MCLRSFASAFVGAHGGAAHLVRAELELVARQAVG